MKLESQEKFAKSLTKTLKNERKGQNLSHEKLADLSGVSRQAIGKIEAGERMPTIYTVHKLAKALGLSLVDFVKKMDAD